jgi:iron-sulfur cluster assembly protein
MSDVAAKTDTAPKIFITDKAADEIKRIITQQNLPEGHGLKIGVVGGGCSGLSYSMDFAESPEKGDKIFEDKGVRLFIDLKSFLYLQNTTLDFSDGLNGRGFMFTNPNAKRSCGCGSSFSV